MRGFSEIEKEIETIIVDPMQLKSTDLVVVNDKLSKSLFSQTLPEWENIATDKLPIEVIEREPRTISTPNCKKTIIKDLAHVSLRVRIRKVVEECIRQSILTEPLNNFDKAILEACATHQYSGKSYITINTIFKYLGGNEKLSKIMYQKIIDSIDKMRFIDIRLDLTDAYKNLKRLQKPNGKPKQENYANLDKIIVTNYLLPAKIATVSISGQRVDAVKFLDISPIFKYAVDKGETARLEQRLLSAPKINNTETNIQLKNYILTRIQSIKRSKRGGGKILVSTLLLSSIYENCGIPLTEKPDRKTKKRIRDATLKYFQYLEFSGEIAEFKTVDDTNTEFDDIAKCTKVVIKC